MNTTLQDPRGWLYLLDMQQFKNRRINCLITRSVRNSTLTRRPKERVRYERLFKTKIKRIQITFRSKNKTSKSKKLQTWNKKEFQSRDIKQNKKCSSIN